MVLIDKTLVVEKFDASSSKLDLSNLDIDRIDSVQSDCADLLAKVETLDLSNNKISFIGELVLSTNFFPNLNILLLFNNQLNEEVFAALKLASKDLRVLKLYGNNIRNLDGLNLKMHEQLEIIKLDFAQSHQVTSFFHNKLPDTYKVIL